MKQSNKPKTLLRLMSLAAATAAASACSQSAIAGTVFELLPPRAVTYAAGNAEYSSGVSAAGKVLQIPVRAGISGAAVGTLGRALVGAALNPYVLAGTVAAGLLLDYLDDEGIAPASGGGGFSKRDPSRPYNCGGGDCAWSPPGSPPPAGVPESPGGGGGLIIDPTPNQQSWVYSQNPYSALASYCRGPDNPVPGCLENGYFVYWSGQGGGTPAAPPPASDGEPIVSPPVLPAPNPDQLAAIATALAAIGEIVPLNPISVPSSVSLGSSSVTSSDAMGNSSLAVTTSTLNLSPRPDISPNSVEATIHEITETSVNGAPNITTSKFIDPQGDVRPVESAPTVDQCKLHPNTVGCLELGPVDTTVVPATSLTIAYTPFTLGGAGVCPSPRVVSFAGQSLAWSFQPICDFAGLIRPIVLALGYLLGAYIFVGGVRQT